MNNIFIFDACALIALLAAEPGAEKIKEFPIEVITGLNADVFKEAGRIKSKYKIPLADSIAVAECIINKGILVTSDHTDLDKIENSENIKIYWFR